MKRIALVLIIFSAVVAVGAASLLRRGHRPPMGPPPWADRDETMPRVLKGIQWFATWESGLREAQRTGWPILLVSGAPHCAGVSGIW